MWRVALASLCLTLLGCASNDRFYVTPRSGDTVPTGDSENMRVVMGQPVTVAPLTPEPGDIWADLATGKPAAAPTRHALPTQHAERTSPQAAMAVSQVPTRAAPSEPAARRSETKAATRPPVASQPGTKPGHFLVQLAAANSEAAARIEWRHLQKRMPQLISGLVPTVMSAELDGRQFWRLRTGDFANTDEANAFCARMHAEQSRCWVVAVAAAARR